MWDFPLYPCARDTWMASKAKVRFHVYIPTNSPTLPHAHTPLSFLPSLSIFQPPALPFHITHMGELAQGTPPSSNLLPQDDASTTSTPHPFSTSFSLNHKKIKSPILRQNNIQEGKIKYISINTTSVLQTCCRHEWCYRQRLSPDKLEQQCFYVSMTSLTAILSVDSGFHCGISLFHPLNVFTEKR